MRQRLREWSAQPPTWKDVTAALGGLFVATMLAVAGFALWVDDQFDAGRVGDAEVRDRVEGIDKRVVRIERGSRRLCRRSVRCRQAIRRAREVAQAPAAPGRPERDRVDDRPDQRADRPPRAPAQPPSTPSPTPGGGGDDPPTPPGASTPSTPPTSPSAPSAPAPVVDVDRPALDLDGPDGLLPGLNLPPVDAPPVRLP